MSRSIRLLTGVSTAGLLWGLVALAGCAPIRDDAAPGASGGAEMAVLTADSTGRYDIQVMDLEGNVLQEIDANVANAMSLSYHPEGYFLVSDGSNIHRVEFDGDVVRWNQSAMPSVVYRMYVSGDGDTTVAEEYDVTELDPDGEIINHVNTGEFCWMDAGPGNTVLDIFGPTLATWNVDTGDFETIATGLGQSSNVMGQDAGGNWYVGAQYEGDIWVVTPQGERNRLGSLSQLGVQAYGVKALESVSHDSVYALYEGQRGSGIVELGADGTISELMTADNALWMDLVVY